MDYIRSLTPKGREGECFLCLAATEPESKWEDLLVLWRTPLTVVLLNRFPYANGHLLISPLRHVAEFEDLTPEELAEIGVQTQKGLTLLRQQCAAQGFNIGINLGRVAGAGVPGHLHQHAVPRWGGDVNFMSVVGEVKVLPQALTDLYRELRTTLKNQTKP